MRVRVRFFGALRDHAPASEVSREMTVGGTVGELLTDVRREKFVPDELLGVSAIAVNHEYVLPTHVLLDGDEVAILPPVSGGSA